MKNKIWKKYCKKIKNKFITLDIETQTINNELIPFTVCFYDGLLRSTKQSFYLTDYKNSEEMLLDVIESLLKRKYNGYNVYCHNLSSFDGIFLFRLLAIFSNKNKDKFVTKLTPMYNKKTGKIINLKLNYSPIKNKRTLKYNICFKDSLLMLPKSLEELAIKFNIESLLRQPSVSGKKTIFPYNFVNNKYNPNIDLEYIGKIPSMQYFKKHIDAKDYAKYLLNYTNSQKARNNASESWSLREEAIKYCTNDCIILYKVLKL